MTEGSTMSSAMRHVLPASISALLLASCSQAPIGAAPGPAGSAGPTLTANGAPASAASGSAEDEMSGPREPFTDPLKNFDAARKALLEGYYRDSLTEEDLYGAAVAGMLERADPAMHKWNKLLSPTDVAELRIDLSGELVGVGIKIDFDQATGYIDVKGTFAGSPADRAGIAPPDKIVTIDGKLYKGLTLHEAVADIRGKAGETVTLSILRGAQLVSVPVVRERVSYNTVQDMVLPGNIGYVRIPAFNVKTPGTLHDALADLASKRARALVLDLRCNQGGSFDDSVAAAGELVPAGSTVVTVNKRGKIEPITAKTTPVLPDMPIAVLVDHDTSSSAELVTAAVQELRHGTVVGSKTNGKWTVQRLEDLPNGFSIKFTVGIFASPSGKSYEGTGLTPDVEVDWSDEAIAHAQGITDPAKRLAEDVQLRTAVAILAR
jgi:carboxyl-terminal processing protease